MMSLDTLLEHLDAGQPLVTGTEAFDCMHGYSYEAMRLTAELNNAFHTPEEIREIMGRITGRPIDETFRLFPPFYTDFGKNIRIGRRVFINACCCFQDQGGISIGDGTLIGHRVTLASINHGLPPGPASCPQHRAHRHRQGCLDRFRCHPPAGGACGRWRRGGGRICGP